MTNDRTNILVAVRVRPLLGKEGTEAALQVSLEKDRGGFIFVDRGGISKQFAFDYVFGPDSEQTDVFASVKPLVESVLDGYNATVFAYGQTGSGKTFTMGTDALSLADAQPSNDCSSRQGVVSRSTEYLFSMMSERRCQALTAGKPVPEFSVSVVFVEIYNDDVVDLLCGKKLSGGPTSANTGVPGMKRATTVVKSKPVPKKANVRSNEHGDIILDGVTSIPCDSSSAILSCLQEGSLARRTATTAYNERSSRSHAIFTIIVNQHRFVKPVTSSSVPSETENENTFDDLADEVLVAKMHFVDLAGSERLHDAIVSTGHAAQERFREGVNINMGLLTLGKVISLLSEGKMMQQYIPYRESKLTRLLQDSLGGNSRTLMIACVSAAECYIEQSINTLQYATNARKIKNQAVINRASSVAQLRAEIQMLRKRLESRNGCDPDVTVELLRVRQENDELRGRINSLNELLTSVQQKDKDLSDKNTQTDLTEDSAVTVLSKYVASRSSDINGDSTLTDSKVQLTNSFKHLIEHVVSQQAEVMVLKEQISTLPAVFSPGPSGRFLSVPFELGLLREQRAKRKRNVQSTANSSMTTSTNSINITGCSDKESTPQCGEPKESSVVCDSVFTASSVLTNEDDEYRDPSYEPTPLRNADGRTRRRFELAQDDLGNRRLTRAKGLLDKSTADLDYGLPKKSRLDTNKDEGCLESARSFCQCRGFCKATARCACKRSGNSCIHNKNEGSGCQCDANVCNNKLATNSTHTVLEEEISVGAEKIGGMGRRR